MTSKHVLRLVTILTYVHLNWITIDPIINKSLCCVNKILFAFQTKDIAAYRAKGKPDAAKKVAPKPEKSKKKKEEEDDDEDDEEDDEEEEEEEEEDDEEEDDE